MISPDRLLESAINSFTFLIGSDGCDTSSSGTLTTLAMAVKSRSVSYGSFT